MKKSHIITLVFMLLASASGALAQTACPADAKLCPDGSSVGRTGPNCEFSACPSVSGSASGGTSGTGGTVVTGSSNTPTSGGGSGMYNPNEHRGATRNGEVTNTLPKATPEDMKFLKEQESARGKIINARAVASTTRGEMKQKIEDRRGEIEQKRDEIKNNKQNRMADMLKKQGERVIKRLEAALDRLTNIAGRIDSRITKLEAKGVNTTKAKADLAIAKTKIEAAKVKLAAAKTAIATVISGSGTVASSTPSGDTPGSMMSGKIMLIKEQVRGVEAALKEAHKALVVATTDLKGKSDTATTTTHGTD